MRESGEREVMYVGYRPVPRQMRRALMVVVPGVVMVLGLIGVVMGVSQRSPGRGVWDERVVTMSGVMVREPVPALIVRDEGGAERVVLLVEEGKHGAQERAARMAGVSVRVEGTSLRRDGEAMLEIRAVTEIDGDAGRGTEVVWREEARTWRGELVDAKCFLGAMKPGDGKTHKACATLCVSNGIPAMLVTSEGAMTVVSGMDDEAMEMIGEPVEVRGVEGRWGERRVMRIERVRRVGVLK
ncbi:MAG TPA: hypothetical protein VK157_05255 [Phycisphaerales bacterium]|nr:hypothetical protein [Phycisphaerales bacterium]